MDLFRDVARVVNQQALGRLADNSSPEDRMEALKTENRECYDNIWRHLGSEARLRVLLTQVR